MTFKKLGKPCKYCKKRFVPNVRNIKVCDKCYKLNRKKALIKRINKRKGGNKI